jgi:hypothetical protein
MPSETKTQKIKSAVAAAITLFLVAAGLMYVAVVQHLLEKRASTAPASQEAQWIEEKAPAWHLQLDDSSDQKIFIGFKYGDRVYMDVSELCQQPGFRAHADQEGVFEVKNQTRSARLVLETPDVVLPDSLAHEVWWVISANELPEGRSFDAPYQWLNEAHAPAKGACLFLGQRTRGKVPRKLNTEYAEPVIGLIGREDVADIRLKANEDTTKVTPENRLESLRKFPWLLAWLHQFSSKGAKQCGSSDGFMPSTLVLPMQVTISNGKQATHWLAATGCEQLDHWSLVMANEDGTTSFITLDQPPGESGYEPTKVWTTDIDGDGIPEFLIKAQYDKGSRHVLLRLTEGEGGGYQNPYDWQWLDMPSSGASVVLDTNVRQMVFDFSWAYYGVFSAFTTSWILTDDHGLQNVFHYGVTGYQWNAARNTYEFTTSIYNEHTGYALPIVLNLDGQGIKYTEVRDSEVRFDVDHDGVADKLAWAAAGNGVLGIDLNGDQQISDASEFSFAQYVPGATTDLQGLAAFDTNHNQQLDKGDERWGQFGVWEDKNADGQTQQGEYRTLEQLNIQSIDLTSNGQASGMNTEAVVTGTTHFTRGDGSTGQAADVMLAYQSGQDVAAMAEEALLMRMALVFNQHCNTGDATAEPLAFVNWAQAGSSGHWETPTSAELDHPALLALAAGKQDTGAAAQLAALNDKALA